MTTFPNHINGDLNINEDPLQFVEAWANQLDGQSHPYMTMTRSAKRSRVDQGVEQSAPIEQSFSAQFPPSPINGHNSPGDVQESNDCPHNHGNGIEHDPHCINGDIEIIPASYNHHRQQPGHQVPQHDQQSEYDQELQQDHEPRQIGFSGSPAERMKKFDRPKLTESEKKHNHNISETRRRDNLKKSYQYLSEVVPFCKGRGRSEAHMLEETIRYVEKASHEGLQLVSELRSLGEPVREDAVALFEHFDYCMPFIGHTDRKQSKWEMLQIKRPVTDMREHRAAVARHEPSRNCRGCKIARASSSTVPVQGSGQDPFQQEFQQQLDASLVASTQHINVFDEPGHEDVLGGVSTDPSPHISSESFPSSYDHSVNDDWDGMDVEDNELLGGGPVQ